MLNTTLDRGLNHWCRRIFAVIWFDLGQGQSMRFRAWSRVATVMPMQRARELTRDMQPPPIFWRIKDYRLPSFVQKPSALVDATVGHVLVHASGAFRICQIHEWPYLQWLRHNDPSHQEGYTETAEDCLTSMLDVTPEPPAEVS